MLVANESQWSTEDLVAITSRILAMPEFSNKNFSGKSFNSFGIRAFTLLLFKTSRKRRWRSQDPDAVTFEMYPKAYHDTRLVLIRSIDKIQLDLLDRIANSDLQQDMSRANLLLLAKTIGRAIGGYAADSFDYSWAEEMTIRVNPYPKRSRIAAERAVAAIRTEQDTIHRGAKRAIENLDKKISAIENRKTAAD